MQGRRLPPFLFTYKIYDIMKEKVKPRTATGPVTAEARKMAVGEIVLFPFDRYENTTVRSTISALYKERSEGMLWRSRANLEKMATEVIRVS